ncbi:MAG TPA: subtype I-E CRISPR-associated endonuclease Cas1, partial [Deltaproteobacteria bacterium]|nr:subtype I-E CRISPR-associated endonuclease Cas1 [Deltaproteobacteria bacterium]
YEIRFGEAPPAKRSVEQLRGIEGARVRKMYNLIAARYGFDWSKRNYDTENWEGSDLANRCLSTATSCLYGITEAAVLAAGYSPGIGFIHFGKPLSFVYDIADLFKFETVVPVAFHVAKQKHPLAEREVRYRCRDSFRQSKILQRLIPIIHEVLAAGGLEPPASPENIQPIAIPNPEQTGDDGHRS